MPKVNSPPVKGSAKKSAGASKAPSKAPASQADGKQISSQGVVVVTYDEVIRDKGLALTLADLAENHALSVEDVAKSSEALASVGLPDDMASRRSLCRLAHKLLRDRIDATLWRCNRPLTQPAPVLSQSEVDTLAQGVISNEKEKTLKAERRLERREKRLAAALDPSVAVEQIKGKGGSAAPKGERTAARTSLWGFAGTAVVRWLGKQGVAFEQTKAILARHGLAELSDSTVKIQLRAGQTGDRGEPAALSPAQAKELMGN